MRKCDLCDRPAVVHEVTVKDGVHNEVHLCEHHASEAGVHVPVHQPINQLLTQLVVCKESGRSSRASKTVCRACGLPFAAFRQAGLLGCPKCYDSFVKHLGPMIERAQNGGTSHAGKCPRRGGASIDRRLRIERLSRELEDAVAAEQYERAAELRDRLQELSGDVAAPSKAGES